MLNIRVIIWRVTEYIAIDNNEFGETEIKLGLTYYDDYVVLN